MYHCRRPLLVLCMPTSRDRIPVHPSASHMEPRAQVPQTRYLIVDRRKQAYIWTSVQARSYSVRFQSLHQGTFSLRTLTRNTRAIQANRSPTAIVDIASHDHLVKGH